MQNIAVVYYSGYGHTKLVAEKVAQGAHADLISIDNEGNITEQEWEKLDAADAIIFGAPTYMGGAPWQFKKFADASSKAWFTRKWQDKVFGGFTNSASLNGDKQVTLISSANAGFTAWRSVGEFRSGSCQCACVNQGRCKQSGRFSRFAGAISSRCGCRPNPYGRSGYSREIW